MLMVVGIGGFNLLFFIAKKLRNISTFGGNRAIEYKIHGIRSYQLNRFLFNTLHIVRYRNISTTFAFLLSCFVVPWFYCSPAGT
jgi:hypothetical protein